MLFLILIKEHIIEFFFGKIKQYDIFKREKLAIALLLVLQSFIFVGKKTYSYKRSFVMLKLNLFGMSIIAFYSLQAMEQERSVMLVEGRVAKYTIPFFLTDDEVSSTFSLSDVSLYDFLGIRSDATPDIIQSAYQYQITNSNKNPRNLNRAKKILLDRQMRRLYDTFGTKACSNYLMQSKCLRKLLQVSRNQALKVEILTANNAPWSTIEEEFELLLRFNINWIKRLKCCRSLEHSRLKDQLQNIVTKLVYYQASHYFYIQNYDRVTSIINANKAYTSTDDAVNWRVTALYNRCQSYKNDRWLN